MKIRIDNLDRTDGMVNVWGAVSDLLISRTWVSNPLEETILGSRWEVTDGCLFTVISDGPDLVKRLTAEGYEVNDDEYYPWENTVWAIGETPDSIWTSPRWFNSDSEKAN